MKVGPAAPPLALHKATALGLGEMGAGVSPLPGPGWRVKLTRKEIDKERN